MIEIKEIVNDCCLFLNVSIIQSSHYPFLHSIITSSIHPSIHHVCLRLLALGGLALGVILIGSETEAVGNLVEDVNVVVGTSEGLLARAPSIDGDVSEGVDTLALGGVEGAVDDEAALGVRGVSVVLVADLDGSGAGLLVDLVVLTVVGGGTEATSDGVAGLPVSREVHASSVVDVLRVLGVLRLARLLVDTDGAALVAVVILSLEVLGVGRTPNTGDSQVSMIGQSARGKELTRNRGRGQQRQ